MNPLNTRVVAPVTEIVSPGKITNCGVDREPAAAVAIAVMYVTESRVNISFAPVTVVEPKFKINTVPSDTNLYPLAILGMFIAVGFSVIS